MPTLADFKRELKTSEGEIAHMYKDTTNNVTVGVGFMVLNAAAAQQLRFVKRGTVQAATPAEIQADFDAVKKAVPGMRARFYADHTKLDLATGQADQLLTKKLDGFKADLRRHFPGHDQFPLAAQLALLDMAYNLGIGGLNSKFPKLKQAVLQKDWKAAAAECNRPQLSPQRNTLVKNWFLEAAKSAK